MGTANRATRLTGKALAFDTLFSSQGARGDVPPTSSVSEHAERAWRRPLMVAAGLDASTWVRTLIHLAGP